MSFFSSLLLFYPGKPPPITVGHLREFSSRMREIIPFSPWIQAVKLKYGKSIARDAKSTTRFKQILANMWQSVPYKWDHEKNGSNLPWADLWPASKFDSNSAYRAHISFGGLPREVSTEFAATNPKDPSSYIAPDMASLSVDPFSPATLNDEDERDIISWLSLGFAGNGYFSWRKEPFASYWQEVRGRPTLQRVRQLCREAFPVPSLPFMEEMKADLGSLFMNREEYQEGDWVVTVSETG